MSLLGPKVFKWSAFFSPSCRQSSVCYTHNMNSLYLYLVGGIEEACLLHIPTCRSIFELCSITLLYMSVHLPMLYFLNYYNCIISFKFRWHNSSHLFIFSPNCYSSILPFHMDFRTSVYIDRNILGFWLELQWLSRTIWEELMSFLCWVFQPMNIDYHSFYFGLLEFFSLAFCSS